MNKETKDRIKGVIFGNGIPDKYIRGLLKRDILEEKIDLFTEINTKDNDL